MARTKKADKRIQEEKQRAETLALLEMPDSGWDEDEPGHRAYIKKDKRGRPTVMTKQVLVKLEQAFKIGCPDREACIYAGISLDTLYNYCKKNPDFSEQKEEWKENPVLAARAVITNAITGKKSVPDAWEYLRRKRKKEFSELKEVEVSNPITVDDLNKIQNGQIEIIEDPQNDIPSNTKGREDNPEQKVAT